MNRITKALVALMFCACTDESGSVNALESHGFTNIKLGGYAFMACSDKDTFATSFTATNQAGKSVSGAVCCGFFKNCTVRF